MLELGRIIIILAKPNNSIGGVAHKRNYVISYLDKTIRYSVPETFPPNKIDPLGFTLSAYECLFIVQHVQGRRQVR